MTVMLCRMVLEHELHDLGRRVEQARLQRGWSKEQAARVAGISSITWKRVEDGRSVHDAKRYAVLQAVGLADASSTGSVVDARVEEVRSWGLPREQEERIVRELLRPVGNHPPAAEEQTG